MGELDQKRVDQAEPGAEQKHNDDRELPGYVIIQLQADHEDVPKHDPEANREINLAGRHWSQHRQGQQRDNGLVVDQRVGVSERWKRVRE